MRRRMYHAIVSLIITAAICILLKYYTDPRLIWHSTTGHSLVEICGTLFAYGIIYCLWIQYSVTAERRILLATIAFSGFALSSLVQALLNLFDPNSVVNLYNMASIFCTAWYCASAILLIAAAGSTEIDLKERCRATGTRRLTDSVVLSLIFTFIAFEIYKLQPRLENIFPGISTWLLNGTSEWSFFTYLVPAALLALYVYAYFAFVKSYIRSEDNFSGGMQLFLLFMIGSNSTLIVSQGKFDISWWISQVLVAVALLVVLVKLGSEFGASYADAHARVDHLEAVHNLSSRLSNTLDLRIILLALVNETAEMLDARYASIMLTDEEGKTLTTMATYGLPDSPLGPKQPQPVEGSGRPGFYSGHTARAFREKRVCIVDDVHSDVEFVPWRQLSKHDGYSVSVPLIYHDVAMGVLNLFFDKHIPMNEERIRLFQTLASAGAVAIANAQLYENTICTSEGEDDITLPMAS